MNLKNKILCIVGIVCFVIFCVSGFLLLDYYLESRKQEKMNADLAKLKHGYTSDSFIIVEALPIDMSENNSKTDLNNQTGDKTVMNEKGDGRVTTSLSSINPDYVFWLQIFSTEIDYPVVHRDNDYYLKRDFYGEKNRHGTIFLDESCNPSGDFLLLHGHNMKDGSMFGSLKDYKQKNFLKDHDALLISYDDRDIEFQIVAALSVDLYDANRFVYEELPRTEEEASRYLMNLKQAALWYEDFTWKQGDKVVVLSTCDYGSDEERLVVFAIEK